MSTEKIMTPGILGIDAGGTFTDLAFLDGKTLELKASAKTPTEHENLIQTIESGLEIILESVDVSAIKSFNLATTLATNAIVEHKAKETAIILIGYNPELVRKSGLLEQLQTEHLFLIAGGHDRHGDEKEPLDESALSNAVASIPADVHSAAVSGYFSVRNTAHENRAFELIKQLRPDMYVSRGSELSTDLNALKRAATTALNAALIPIVMDLLDSVESVCRKLGIEVPVTILRGDGTIVSSDWAKEHPVEMILSGTASSVCGAGFLASKEADDRGCMVVDIGGTTTDIIRMDENGRPVLLDEGAKVANYQTLVKTIDITTFALGGDTHVIFDKERGLYLGNRRVIPLCKLAAEHPEVKTELTKLTSSRNNEEPLFIIASKKSIEEADTCTAYEKSVLKKIQKGPISRKELLSDEIAAWLKYETLDRMESRGLIHYAAFTPTDALHVLGLLKKWDCEAAELGAEVLGKLCGESTEETAGKIKKAVEDKIMDTLAVKLLEESGIQIAKSETCTELISRALNEEGSLKQQLRFYLGKRLVGVGAPSWAFLPRIGENLHETAILPNYAEVAGAVGAAVGSFSLEYSVKIMPIKDKKQYRVHYPKGIRDFGDLEEAISFTQDFMQNWLLTRAKNAGANKPMVTFSKKDEVLYLRALGESRSIYLYTELLFSVSEAESKKQNKNI